MLSLSGEPEGHTVAVCIWDRNYSMPIFDASHRLNPFQSFVDFYRELLHPVVHRDYVLLELAVYTTRYIYIMLASSEICKLSIPWYTWEFHGAVSLVCVCLFKKHPSGICMNRGIIKVSWEEKYRFIYQWAIQRQVALPSIERVLFYISSSNSELLKQSHRDAAGYVYLCQSMYV